MDRELLAALVSSASTAGSPDRGPLSRLAGRCWPHAADGTVPVALDWVRRWAPRPHLAAMPECVCATGRCGTCN